MSTTTAESSLQSGALQAVCAVVSAAIFVFAVEMVFEDLPFAIAVGVLAGVGTLLTIRWIGTMSGEEHEATGLLHDGAAGMAIEGGAAVAFAAYFFVESPVVALGAGVVLAAVEYAVLSQFLPETPEQASESDQ